MSDITNKQDIQIDAALYEVLRVLAFRLVQLHMDTERSELLLGGFKEYLRGRFPLVAPVLIREIDRQVVLQASELPD